MNFDIYFVRDHFQTFAYYGLSTLSLCLVALMLGAIVGATLCYMRTAQMTTLNTAAVVIVGTVRSLPELVLIFWLYTCLPLITGVTFTALQTGVIALTIISGAYLSEIFRAGLQAVDVGQREAGYALGLSRFLSLRLIIIPQATRIMMPPFLNFVCDLIKTSTLLSTLGIAEMSYYAMTLGSVTYKFFEIYTIVGIIYFVFIFSISQAAKIYMSNVGKSTLR